MVWGGGCLISLQHRTDIELVLSGSVLDGAMRKGGQRIDLSPLEKDEMHRSSACTSIIKANDSLEPPCSIPLKPFAWRVNGRFEFLRLKAAVNLCKPSKHMLLNPVNCFP